MTGLADCIRATDRNLEECDVVHNILLTFHKSYKPQRYDIQESNYLSKYSIEQLINTLAAYEILEMEKVKREKRKEKRENKEATFNVSRFDDPK